MDVSFDKNSQNKALDISENLLYSTYKTNNNKPLIGTSICLKHAQRAAGGGNAAMGRTGNGPGRAS